MMLNKIQYGALIAIIIAAATIVYCLMIFPFLKSFGTLAVSVILMIVCLRLYFTFPGIHRP